MLRPYRSLRYHRGSGRAGVPFCLRLPELRAGFLGPSVAGAAIEIVGAGGVLQHPFPFVVQSAQAEAGQGVSLVTGLLVELRGAVGVPRDSQASRVARSVVVAAPRHTGVAGL